MILPENSPQERHPDTKHYLVLRGAATADLPPLTSPLYTNIVCPTLILTIEDDPAHPLSTATALHARIGSSQLHVAVSKVAAQREWPAIIAEFLSKIRCDGHEEKSAAEL